MPRSNVAVNANALPQVPPPDVPLPAALNVDLNVTDEDLGSMSDDLMSLSPAFRRVALVLADPRMFSADPIDVAAVAGVHRQTVHHAKNDPTVQALQARACKSILVGKLPQIMDAMCASACDPESKHGASDRRLVSEIVGLTGAERQQANNISITVTQAPPQQSATLSSIAIVPAGEGEEGEGG